MIYQKSKLTGMRKAKRLLIVAVMLLSVVALSLPSQPASATAMGFCETCASDCYAETWGLGSESYYNTCRSNGGSFEQCTQSSKNNYNACVMVCNVQGCSIPYAQ